MKNDNKAKFREKAKNITQEPSPAAWDKLVGKLDEPKKKKSNIKHLTFYAIAASVAVLFGLMLNGNLFPQTENKYLAKADFEITMNKDYSVMAEQKTTKNKDLVRREEVVTKVPVEVASNGENRTKEVTPVLVQEKSTAVLLLDSMEHSEAITSLASKNHQLPKPYEPFYKSVKENRQRG